MAWDSSRVVPWRRLVREWLIYVGLASAAFIAYYLYKGRKIEIGLFAGLMASGPMYLLFGAVLAKFGYQRKTLKELRSERPAASTASNTARRNDASGAGVRQRPAPTKRTSTGPSQHRKKSNSKRR